MNDAACKCVSHACKFSKDAVSEVDNRPGLYAFFDSDMVLLYVGVSNALRHRLQSYYQKDDFDAHPTKQALRRKIVYFYHEYMPISQARELEKEVKQELRYNHK